MDNDKELGALEYFFVGFDSLINAICLYLLFEFNEEQYYQICECGHTLFEKCCVRLVVGKMVIGVDGDEEEQEPIDFEGLILR